MKPTPSDEYRTSDEMPDAYREATAALLRISAAVHSYRFLTPSRRAGILLDLDEAHRIITAAFLEGDDA